MRTAEAVSKGHPDKVCDQISDAILDACLEQDPDSRVAIETLGGHGIITVCGELTTKAYVDIPEIAKRVYREIGYKDAIGVQVNVVSQSPDISQGVDTGGAGDQGIMIGYACNKNAEMIPQELYLARKILSEVLMLGYGPDGKSQVTLDGDDKICRLVLSVQHKEGEVIDQLSVDHLLDKYPMTEDCEIIINGTGRFVIGGFEADAGVTGRKIVQDAYGPQVEVGGGAFSGKDPSKVDRSAAYMARKIACDYVRNGAFEATVKIAYSIGVAKPLMAQVHYTKSVGVGTPLLDAVEDLNEKYDLTPAGIIKALDLKKPIYRQTAENGHFGHQFPWDK